VVRDEHFCLSRIARMGRMNAWRANNLGSFDAGKRSRARAPPWHQIMNESELLDHQR
jgi:hypothetical protein